MMSLQVSVATETVWKPGALPGGSAVADNDDHKELMERNGNGKLKFESRSHIRIIIVHICISHISFSLSSHISVLLSQRRSSSTRKLRVLTRQETDQREKMDWTKWRLWRRWRWRQLSEVKSWRRRWAVQQSRPVGWISPSFLPFKYQLFTMATPRQPAEIKLPHRLNRPHTAAAALTWASINCTTHTQLHTLSHSHTHTHTHTPLHTHRRSYLHEASLTFHVASLTWRQLFLFCFLRMLQVWLLHLYLSSQHQCSPVQVWNHWMCLQNELTHVSTHVCFQASTSHHHITNNIWL